MGNTTIEEGVKGKLEMAEAIQQTAATNRTGGKSKKALLITFVVVIQLVAAYFLVALFLRAAPQDSQAAAGVSGKMAGNTRNPERADPNFDHVYVVKDLIVNPAGTNGLRFLLTTIGLEVSSEETVKELEKRDVQIHDSIIGILTSRTLPELDNMGVRDSLKYMIKNAINRDLSSGTVLNVYFSKFIIQ